MSKKYRVTINLRQGVKDIQSEAIFKTANGNVNLGNGKLHSLSMGKWFVIECADDFDIENMCKGFLANTVIEDYLIEELNDGRDI